MKNEKTVHGLFAVILAIWIPFLILMAGIRLAMTPAFPAFEYNRPGFPEDTYGFDRATREKWSGYAVKYLTNEKDISYLGNLQDIQGNKIFRSSELSHMEDVKRLVNGALITWYILGGLTIALTLYFLVRRDWKVLQRAYFWGGVLTVVLMVAMLVLLALNFNNLFDHFHQVFFKEGTWIFFANDTLIRLFPIVFWRDAFILVGGFTLIVAVLLIIIFWPRKKKIDQTTVPVAVFPDSSGSQPG